MARKDLLDLTARNRLLNTPRSGIRSAQLEIVDELSEQVFQILVAKQKMMKFLAVPEKTAEANTEDGGSFEDTEESALWLQPEDDGSENGGLASRHIDDKLQTGLPSEKLQKRLLKLFYDARTAQEEHGVNLLYLALGFLKWYEDPKSEKERYAPLLLIPVQLERKSADSRFTLGYTGEELNTNLSLQMRLRSDFGIELPDLPDVEELSPDSYYSEVSAAVAQQFRWEVLSNDMVLWFFFFSKFLMFRDLQPESWPEHGELKDHPLINSLLGEAFKHEPPLCSESDSLDPIIAPADMVHILDADSSQTVAIEEVRRGRNLVIQGPPGTGKSQTIANVIASAVRGGRTILFVAEKMAALEVVQRRLANVGLADICLELHSQKANKQAVLTELERTLSLSRPQPRELAELCEDLARCREQLNAHLRRIHTPMPASKLTPYQVLGELVRLRAENVEPPSFTMGNPASWTRSTFDSHGQELRDFVDKARRVGEPNRHPWRGVELERVLPMDVERLLRPLQDITARLGRLIEAGNRFACCCGIPNPRTGLELAALERLGRKFQKAPRVDAKCLANESWRSQHKDINHLVELGRLYIAGSEALSGRITDTAWETDLSQARREFTTHGRSWFRVFYRRYREAMATLRSICSGDPPRSTGECIAFLDEVIRVRSLRDTLENMQTASLGEGAFGSEWRGAASDWDALGSICDWDMDCRNSDIHNEYRLVYANLHGTEEWKSPLKQISSDFESVFDELDTLFCSLKVNLMDAFGTEDRRSIELALLDERLREWNQRREDLSTWTAYTTQKKRLVESDLVQLTMKLGSGEISQDDAVGQFEMAYYEALIRQCYQDHSELRTFDGMSHEGLLRRFRDLDRRRIQLAIQEVAQAHYDRLPRNDSATGELGVLRREIAKKRRHLPIRQLLAQAGTAVQAIKPLFMMSPLSVSQYLEPGRIEFDLLLIDEASQVQPVDALGAVARAKQIVVVGDDKQLPPTSFFSRMTEGDEPEDGAIGEVQTGDLESILGLCCAKNVPQRMLRWHYRSRHHSLIALSNHEFYDNRLYVVPSPGEPEPGQGLIFYHIPEGVFERGGSRTNRVEAKRVAEAIMNHAYEQPDKSLGVGTFSVAQRDAILDELELLRRADPSLEVFFTQNQQEPFFVKNLENIQGDERDVIFISVGYGRTPDGHLLMHFGPLQRDGGERRLNVLITRARESCCVYSSIVGDDIDLSRTNSRGAVALRNFLKYAETGLLDTGTETGRNFDSEFERQVAKAICGRGYEIRPQVGVAGFYIDLAVVDPAMPGRYLLGIECDGANYHRSRSARDRDRLRQAVLEDRGWIIHRIWSTDWFQLPEVELKKALAVIESAKREWVQRSSNSEHAARESREHDTPTIVIREAESSSCSGGAGGSQSTPYVVAHFRIPYSADILELQSSQLAEVVAHIVSVEGPIHCEELARRTARLWGYGRTGKRIMQAVEQAIEVAAREGRIALDGPFCCNPVQTEMRVRDRSSVEENTLKKPEMLPPSEIRLAVSAIIRVNLGVTTEEAVIEAARLLGFKSTSSQLKRVIEQEINQLHSDGVLTARNGKMYIAESATGYVG